MGAVEDLGDEPAPRPDALEREAQAHRERKAQARGPIDRLGSWLKK